MPQKNSIKIYAEGCYYHIYNRGVEKRDIFVDTQDYKVFLEYLKESLNAPPPPEKLRKPFTLQGASFQGVPHQPKNFNKDIELIAYCLMPNHFHLLIKQLEKRAMESFMRSVSTRYSVYFNKKYKRVGKLFQGHYKAVLVKTEEQLLHLSRYIHTNPWKFTKDLTNWYSSYAEYLRIRKTKWIKPKIILDFFERKTLPEIQDVISYKSFVENNKEKRQSFRMIEKLLIE
jgi:putative transposase